MSQAHAQLTVHKYFCHCQHELCNITCLVVFLDWCLDSRILYWDQKWGGSPTSPLPPPSKRNPPQPHSFWCLSPPSPAPILTFTASLCAWVLQEQEEAPTLHWERNHGFTYSHTFFELNGLRGCERFCGFPPNHFSTSLAWKKWQKDVIQSKMFGCKGKNIPPVPFQLSPARAALPCIDQTIICSFIHRAEGEKKKKRRAWTTL